MNNMTNFYDNMDLKYPEIAIAVDPIDRINPGNVRFIIPILTPDLNTDKVVENSVKQNTRNLMNENKNLDIKDISISNYVEIPVPKELCANTDSLIITNGEISINIPQSAITSNGSISGSGDINLITNGLTILGLHDAEYSIRGDISQHGSIYGNGEITGIIHTRPTDDTRYIPAGSKWIVVFIGGDITKPRIIAPYAE